MVRLAFKAVNHAMQKEYKRRLQGIFKALELVFFNCPSCLFKKKIPDFYCEIKWEFKSWIPLVSRIAPHDVYKVFKKGTSLRVDTTLVGFEKMRVSI